MTLDVLGDWFTVERQAPIVGGVVLLLVIWVGEVIEPFALGLPAYAFYFPLSGLGQQLGLVGIEGSAVLFWASAVAWLYLFCSVVLLAAIWATNRVGEEAVAPQDQQSR